MTSSNPSTLSNSASNSSLSSSTTRSKVPLLGSSSTRQLSEVSYDLFHSEMINYFFKQIKLNELTANPTLSENPAELNKLIQRKLHNKLEGLGYSVGGRLCERYSRDLNWFSEQLDVIKFLCKEFWLAVFQKQVDKLQTNYKGIYVLHDFQFRTLTKIHPVHPVAATSNSNPNPMIDSALLDQCRMYTSYSCGLVRGALANLGITASVKVEINKLPAVQFTIIDLEKSRSKTNTNNPQSQVQTQSQSTASASALQTAGAAATTVSNLISSTSS
jgi:hypothetical protein